MFDLDLIEVLVANIPFTYPKKVEELKKRTPEPFEMFEEELHTQFPEYTHVFHARTLLTNILTFQFVTMTTRERIEVTAISPALVISPKFLGILATKDQNKIPPEGSEIDYMLEVCKSIVEQAHKKSLEYVDKANSMN